MPESIYPMISVEEALAIIEREVRPLPTVTMTFEAALGLVLAEDIIADGPMPPFPASSVDGFGVIAADGPGWHRLVGDQMAGYVAEMRVEPGTAARVMTGAPIPPGVDSMVMVEETEEKDGQVNILAKNIEVGANIRPIGQDIEAGQRVLAQGTLLGPAGCDLFCRTMRIRFGNNRGTRHGKSS